MSHSGENRAVTEDGASYNKLRRPDDYLQSLTAPPPPKSELPPKRKFEEVAKEDKEGGGAPDAKRSKDGSPETGRALSGDTRRVFRPIRENGMQTMFPGLDDDSASDADDTTRDALAYLRSVRSEASTIPTLLVATPPAPKDNARDRSMYSNGVGDHRAVYQDGMWVAVDHEAGGYYGDDWEQYEEDIDPQAAYYQSLLDRYETLRNTLANADPREFAALVKADPEKYANVRAPYYKGDWRFTFDNKFPTPALVAQIDSKSLYRALGYLSEVLITEDTISKQKSCWLWTLLAMAGEKGTLDYYRAGRIRELGHKAGQLSIRLRRGEIRKQAKVHQDEGAEEWEVDGEGIDEDDEDAQESDEAIETQANVPTVEGQLETDTNGVEDSEDDYEPPTDIGDQSDGASQPETQANSARLDNMGQAKGSMTMSEDEGETREDAPQDEEAPADLEAARARLLTQLGDNLVKESIPDRKVPAHQLRAKQEVHGEPRQGKRHRHNGKVCKNASCRVNKKQQDARRKAGVRAAQGKEANRPSAATSSKASQAALAPANKQEQTVPSQVDSRTHVDDVDAAFPASLGPGIQQELRRQVLGDSDDDVLQALPAAFAAEGLPDQSAAVRAYANGEIDLAGLLFPVDPSTRRTVLENLIEYADEELLQELQALPSELAAEARTILKQRNGTGSASRSEATGSEDLSPESFLASLDPELRRAVLMGQDHEILRMLPPEIVAEARAYAQNGSGADNAAERDASSDSMSESEDKGEDRREEQVMNLNTRATIDMVLTVVGECYGQRDLLRFREVW